MGPTERYQELERDIERDAREAHEIIDAAAKYRKAIALANVWADAAADGDDLLAAINAQDYVQAKNEARQTLFAILERLVNEARRRVEVTNIELVNASGLFYTDFRAWVRLKTNLDRAEQQYAEAYQRLRQFQVNREG